MRAARKPVISAEIVLDDCLSGMEESESKKRSKSIITKIGAQQADYDALAASQTLHTLPMKKYAEDDVVWELATKGDLINLYEQHLVPRKKLARQHYDKILIAEAKCPYCNLGHSSTLDHFLPKSRFPRFAIIPENLIPCCRDCQFKKGRNVARTLETQTLHPYYDQGHFTDERWVFGRVIPSKPATAEFYANPPKSWNKVDQQRASEHFNAHGLSERFQIEASTELAYLSYLYKTERAEGRFADIRMGLLAAAACHSSVCINSWQSALYRALVEDDWYLNAPTV